MLRIAICEDEKVHEKILVDLIGRYPFETDYFLTTFQYGYELIEASNKGMKYDIIFLDMRLGQEDGIDIANEIRKTDEILYFESLGRKIKVATFETEYEYYYTISALENELDPLRFVLCHRSYIINLKNVKSIRTKTAVLKNGVMIPISPKRNQKVYDAFTRYMAGSME